MQLSKPFSCIFVQRNPDSWPGNVNDVGAEDFAARVARANALKNYHGENQKYLSNLSMSF